ncbi:MAG: HpcH/HpaI aldolase family protein [Anaerolineae bacterium]
MKVNTAKAKMLAGKPALGAAIVMGAPLAGEFYSLQGWDYILVDGQHGNWSLDTLTQAFRSICLGPAIPMARVRQNDFFAIGSTLDRGAMGIVVPMVNTRQQAQAAAYAARFPPYGGRSQGGFGTAFYDVPKYEAWIDQELFLAVQIESAEAVERAEEILGVEGVDGCWIGPADLANSMGVDVSTASGRQKHEDAIMRVLDACHKTGKAPGIAGGTAGERWLEKGFLYVTCAADSAAVRDTGRKTLEFLSKYR